MRGYFWTFLPNSYLTRGDSPVIARHGVNQEEEGEGTDGAVQTEIEEWKVDIDIFKSWTLN